MNGVLSLLGPIWLDWPFSQSPLSSTDQIGLLCQFQSYSWSLCNLNSSYAAQNILCKMCPIFKNVCQINKCRTGVNKSINQQRLKTSRTHSEETPGLKATTMSSVHFLPNHLKQLPHRRSSFSHPRQHCKFGMFWISTTAKPWSKNRHTLWRGPRIYHRSDVCNGCNNIKNMNGINFGCDSFRVSPKLRRRAAASLPYIAHGSLSHKP